MSFSATMRSSFRVSRLVDGAHPSSPDQLENFISLGEHRSFFQIIALRHNSSRLWSDRRGPGFRYSSFIEGFQ